MAADAAGNDLNAVDVPVTGFAAINFDATQAPSKTQIAGNLPSGYSYLGLFTTDGGYAEDTEGGENTEFFQISYRLRTGDESITGTLTCAENNDNIKKLLGFTDGKREQVSYQDKFGLIITTWHKNGTFEARGGLAMVTSITTSQETRGEIQTYEVQFSWIKCGDNGFYSYATGEKAAPSPCSTASKSASSSTSDK